MMTFSNGPMSSSQKGCTQPPKRKPPVGSSSGPPGACMTESSDRKTAPVSLRIRGDALGQSGKLLGDGAPTLLEPHLAMLFHRLGGPVPRGPAIAGAAALGLQLEDPDHERLLRFPAGGECVCKGKAPLG